jgi:dihydrofolate reductase
MNYNCNIIVACTPSGGIGSIDTETGNHCLPWSIPEDLYHFKALTQNSIVIMGRKTYESIPESRRPLRNRIIFVITSQNDLLSKPPDISNETKTVLQYVNWNTLPLILQSFHDLKKSSISNFYNDFMDHIWVIGGKQIYQTILNSSFSTPYLHCSKIYITRILSPVEELSKPIHIECTEFKDTELVNTFHMYRAKTGIIQRSIQSNILFQIEEWEHYHDLL